MSLREHTDHAIQRGL